jgi:tRNA pseudouridine38-40 synthase
MSDPSPTRWRLVMEYDGADFLGWQVQPGGRTVQGVLEEALEQLFLEPVRAYPSGRTDAGVHAIEQVVAFDARVERSPREVRDALNALLPDDVAVVRAERAEPDFDPRRWVEAKQYRYTWVDRPSRSPLRRDRAWHVRGPLDVEAMDAATHLLVGRHDFTSFRAAGCTAAHPVRLVKDMAVVRRDDEVHLDVVGHGFLRHMVRIIAGTLLEVGRGRRPPGWVGEVLAACDRSGAGRTAPPQGLTLLSVSYGAGPPAHLGA